MHRRAGEAGHEHGLFLVAGLDGAPRSRGDAWPVIGDRLRQRYGFVWFPVIKGVPDSRQYAFGADVAIDGQHAVVRRSELLVKGFEVGGSQVANAFPGTDRVESVTGFAEHRAAHRANTAWQH